MKPQWTLPLLALILAALACNWSDVAPPAAPVIEPSPLPTFAISTLTPVPTETPLPTPTSTPDAPLAWPKELGANCRYGPGESWEVVSSIPPGTTTTITGKNVNFSWWYVRDPLNPDSFCWVASNVVETAGSLNFLPIVDPPDAAVTNVSVDAQVDFNACGTQNPVMFNAALTTNGPTRVTYLWEVNGDAQQTIPDETFQFSQAGTQKVTSDAFSADCGEYTVTLRVTSPNETTVQKAFTIQAKISPP